MSRSTLGNTNDNAPQGGNGGNGGSIHDRIIPATKWADYHPWPSVAGLRWLIFHEKTNGFSHCVIRKGRRVLISEQRFFEWTRGHKGAA